MSAGRVLQPVTKATSLLTDRARSITSVTFTPSCGTLVLTPQLVSVSIAL